MDTLTIQKNEYNIRYMNRLIDRREEDKELNRDTLDEQEKETLKRFKLDIYQTYVMIRNVHRPKACEKISLEKVKANLRDHWLDIYCKLSREEAELIIEYAEMFFSLAIK